VATGVASFTPPPGVLRAAAGDFSPGGMLTSGDETSDPGVAAHGCDVTPPTEVAACWVAAVGVAATAAKTGELLASAWRRRSRNALTSSGDREAPSSLIVPKVRRLGEGVKLASSSCVSHRGVVGGSVTIFKRCVLSSGR
jgi:hypothetical protein